MLFLTKYLPKPLFLYGKGAGKYIATHLTQFMCPQLCTNSRQKPEINIYYTSHILNFFKKILKLSFKISVEI